MEHLDSIRAQALARVDAAERHYKMAFFGAVALESVMLILLMALRLEWLFIFVLALIGFFLYSTSPVLNAWALDIAPPHLGGTSIGILFASQSLLGGIAPVLGGFIADQYGIETTFYFIAATVLVANLMIVTKRLEVQVKALGRAREGGRIDAEQKYADARRGVAAVKWCRIHGERGP